MKAHLFAISLLGISTGVAQQHGVAALEKRLDPSFAVSVCYTYQTTYLTTVSTSTRSSSIGAPSASPSSSIAFFPIVLGVVTNNPQKRDLEKRVGLGGFVSDNEADPNPSSCLAGTIFYLQVGGGLLLDAGQPLYFLTGFLFEKFKSVGAPPQGAITTFFNIDASGFLSWTNQAFLNGAAGFCQVPATGQVYATFGQQTSTPVGCVTVRLQVYRRKICPISLIR